MPQAAPAALTLGDIIRAHGTDYHRNHRLCGVQDKALRAIARCRTAALGGHRYRCDHCGAETVQYNSCRNRHCPTCQTTARLRWLEGRETELLPVPYFDARHPWRAPCGRLETAGVQIRSRRICHVVFTLPHELNALAQGNPKTLYTLLFKATADTLKTFAADPKHLGAQPGITLVLHTWGQNLSQHIHTHGIVTGGGLSADGAHWIPCKRNPHTNKVFLFPVDR